MRNRLLRLNSFIVPIMLSSITAMAQPVNLTHSTSQSIIYANSVSCNYGATYSFNHAENSYFRVFDLSSMGVTGDCLEITSIEVGVENATAASSNQPINIRLYSLTGAMSSANLTLITSQTFSLPNKTLSVHSFPFYYVLSPTNITLVVEINAPDGFGSNTFFIGSNNLGESSPGYLMSVPCGITDPLTLATIGFANMHIVMNVKGNNLFTPDIANNFALFRDTVCEGSTNVTYSVPISSGNPTYMWSYSGTGVTINGTGNSVTLNFSSGATPGVLSVYTTNACGTSDTLSRAIAIESQVSFAITPPNPEICIGDTITLTAHGGATYRWEPPTGLDTLYGPIVNASPGLSHSYTVVGDDSFGCFGTGTVFVTVHPLPTVLFNPENTTICAGVQDTIVLDGAATYAWLPTTGLTLSATGDTAILNLNNTTTYTIEAVSHFGCESTTTKTVNVNPNPTPVITFDGERLMSAPTGYVTYMWYVDGYPIIPIAWQHLYNIKKPGAYHVVVTDSNGCEGMSNIIDTKPLGINDVFSNSVNIYPNPTNGIINIECAVPVTIEVKSIDGRSLLSVNDTKVIDITHLSEGMYFIVVKEMNGNGVMTQKITKSSK